MLGFRIKKLREEKNLNQLELAKLLNISNTTLSQYESGQRTPSDDIKMKMSTIFDVSVDYLLGNSNIRNPYKEDKKLKKEEYIFPEEFTNADEARAYVNKHQIFGYDGFDSDRLDDDEIIEFANALLEQMKMVSYKYRK